MKQVHSYLVKEEDTEISSKYDNVYGHTFTNPTTIKSQLELRYKTILYLEEKKCDGLFLVAETGEWLVEVLKSNFSLAKKKLVLVYADSAHNSKLNEFIKSDKLHWLPWWEHNQHMTLFLSKKDIIHAFYFTRRLRSSHISPVEITEDKENDLKILREIFAVYYKKAKMGVTIISKDLLNDGLKDIGFDPSKD